MAWPRVERAFTFLVVLVVGGVAGSSDVDVEVERVLELGWRGGVGGRSVGRALAGRLELVAEARVFGLEAGDGALELDNAQGGRERRVGGCGCGGCSGRARGEKLGGERGCVGAG